VAPSGATDVEGRGDASFSTPEAALLCCFGLDQDAKRNHRLLRAALINAGLPAGATGYLVRRSPLLQRVSRGQYRLRPFAPGN
jgi:hypothetical protein